MRNDFPLVQTTQDGFLTPNKSSGPVPPTRLHPTHEFYEDHNHSTKGSKHSSPSLLPSPKQTRIRTLVRESEQVNSRFGRVIRPVRRRRGRRHDFTMTLRGIKQVAVLDLATSTRNVSGSFNGYLPQGLTVGQEK